MSSSALTRGAHHIGLTVADLVEAQAFFIDLLGFHQVGEIPEYPAVFVSDGHTMITLWRAEDPATATPFDRRRNIGLHHLALAVDGAGALDAMHRRLAAAAAVEVEFAPQPLGGGGTRHMMCRIGGGIRLELIATAS